MKTSLLTLALGASMLALVATPATSVSAQDVQKVSATVSYGDLNLSTREGAKAMYQRIKSTARKLCGAEPAISEFGAMDGWRACISDSVNSAVTRLDAPMVTAFNGHRSASSVQLAQAH
ncbi:MAG TPA: UrcA family protein [Caulobacteraceae bacterium]|jgi:UrcA family protein